MSSSFEWKPMTDTVRELRAKYRDTKPTVCTARLRLVTDYYKAHGGEPGLVLKSGSFKYLCENMPIVIRDKEIICGNVAVPYRGSYIYPEAGGLGNIAEELRSGAFRNRELEPYNISEEDEQYIYEVEEFWDRNCTSMRVDACAMDGLEGILGNGVLRHRGKGGRMHGGPVGHFCTNYDKMLYKGFAAVRAEAAEKMSAMEGKLFGDNMDKYHFYRAVTQVCDGAIIYAERVAKAAAEKAAEEKNADRRAELYEMAANYNHMFKNPVEGFFEAVEALFLYQILLTLDGNLHGMSWGRVDQYLGRYYEKDLKDGKITEDRAQEIMDQFFLRVQELNRVSPAGTSKSAGGYTSGQLMTLGGVKKDGSDASNPVSYMMLQASGRLKLHDPTMALRVSDKTPAELIEAAIRCTMEVGGIPTFESDKAIIPGLKAIGHDDESANNYCMIGCVEPGGCGDAWPAPGGSGGESYFNIANVLIQTINNGVNPVLSPGNAPGKVTGLQLGYLYDYKTFEELQDAFLKELEFFIDWQVSQTNMFEYAARDVIPEPIVSCMMDGCMEKGADVMRGGAKYNSTGIAGVGIGTAAQSLNVIRELVFEKKACTAKELYDAVMADWVGYDELREKAQAVTHYGNGEERYDELYAWASEKWCELVQRRQGPRGPYKAGLWSIARHVADGPVTNATPDGRKLGDVLSDGIGPVQGTDREGPTALLRSVAAFDHSLCRNGTLLNMRFSKTAVRSDEDIAKLGMLIRTFFEMGGMELQFNFVSADTMRAAKKDPKSYRDLVVRVAGFSAFFTEIHPGLQDEIIRRTELQSV